MTQEEQEKLFDEYVKSSDSPDLSFKDWNSLHGRDVEKYKQYFRQPAHKISTISEARALAFLDDSSGQLNDWIEQNTDLLSPELLGISRKEVATADFYKLANEYDLLWKRITRAEGYHGEAAKEVETLLEKAQADLDCIGNYTTLAGFDMSVNRDWAADKLNLLYRMQAKYKPGELRNSKHHRLRDKYEWFDPSQTEPASPEFIQKMTDKYYHDYPVVPFISRFQEQNPAPWADGADISSVVPVEMMRTLPNGLLPGHIWELYWIDIIDSKRIPEYFEYGYGISFMDGVRLLKEKGYIDKDGAVSEKGFQAMKTYKQIIIDH